MKKMVDTMSVKWKYPIHVTKNQIDEALKQLGVTLPDDYIEVVALNNSASPEPHCFKLENGEEKVMSYLLSFDLSEKRNIVSVWNEMRNVLPVNVFPIADDPFGNFIAYQFDKVENPHLVYWNHELRKLSTITDTFTDLLKSLT